MHYLWPLPIHTEARLIYNNIDAIIYDILYVYFIYTSAIYNAEYWLTSNPVAQRLAKEKNIYGGNSGAQEIRIN